MWPHNATIKVPDQPPWRWGLLATPIFWAAVATLLVNDHILKAAYPGVITGKLSDVAGVIMVGMAAVAIVRRTWSALGATAFGFALVKTVPPVNHLSEPFLGGHTLLDATDVAAAFALIPLGLWIDRRRSALATRLGRASCRWRRGLGVLGVLAAVGATTATSVAYDETINALGVYGSGEIYARTTHQQESVTTQHYVLTPDSGGDEWDWKRVDEAPADVRFVNEQDEACLDDGTCVRRNENEVEEVDPEGGVTRVVPNGVIELDASSSIIVSNGSIAVVSEPPAHSTIRRPDGTWEWVHVGGPVASPEIDRFLLLSVAVFLPLLLAATGTLVLLMWTGRNWKAFGLWGLALVVIQYSVSAATTALSPADTNVVRIVAVQGAVFTVLVIVAFVYWAARGSDRSSAAV